MAAIANHPPAAIAIEIPRPSNANMRNHISNSLSFISNTPLQNAPKSTLQRTKQETNTQTLASCNVCKTKVCGQWDIDPEATTCRSWHDSVLAADSCNQSARAFRVLLQPESVSLLWCKSSYFLFFRAFKRSRWWTNLWQFAQSGMHFLTSSNARKNRPFLTNKLTDSLLVLSTWWKSISAGLRMPQCAHESDALYASHALRRNRLLTIVACLIRSLFFS